MKHALGSAQKLGVVLFMVVAFASAYGSTKQLHVDVIDPWCSMVNSAEPGTEIVFSPGHYALPCVITVRGQINAPIVLRSSDASPEARAVFMYPKDAGPVFLLENAEFVTLRWLTFAGTQPDIDGVRVRGGHDITVEECLFEDLGGIAVVSNQRDAENITVRDNTIRNVRSTAMYFGCQDGRFCHIKGLLVEGNSVSRVQSLQVGYGLEVKLNSYGIVRNNTFCNTKGPGIAMYGSNEGGVATRIESNYVEGAQTDAGIVIAGGPAIIRNNILVANRDGIYAQNYQHRDLQRDVWIVNNTVINNVESGVTVQGWRPLRGNVLAWNAIAQGPGSTPIEPALPAGIIMRNVICRSAVVCFEQPLTAPFDFRPKAKSPLVASAGAGESDWRAKDDFFGTPRPKVPDVGAIQRKASGEETLVKRNGARPKQVGCPTSADNSTN